MTPACHWPSTTCLTMIKRQSAISLTYLPFTSFHFSEQGPVLFHFMLRSKYAVCQNSCYGKGRLVYPNQFPLQPSGLIKTRGGPIKKAGGGLSQPGQPLRVVKTEGRNSLNNIRTLSRKTEKMEYRTLLSAGHKTVETPQRIPNISSTTLGNGHWQGTLGRTLARTLDMTLGVRLHAGEKAGCWT